MMQKWIFFSAFICVSLCLPVASIAQRSVKREGDRMFAAGKYFEALSAYQRYKKTKDDAQLLVKRGICYLNTNQPDLCIADMDAAHRLKSLNNKRFYYMAQANVKKGDYAEAAKLYKVYLDKIESKTDEWYQVIHHIKQCGEAIDISYMSENGYVENLGNDINTVFDEIGPVQSPTDQERFYFSSARETSTGGMMDANGLEDNITGSYRTDMYKIELNDGKWSSVLPFEYVLNSSENDILQDFNPNGMEMYFVKTPDRKRGVIFADTFSLDRDNMSVPRPAALPFKPELGDKDLHIFSDSLIFFASTQYKGFGGYDIYYSQKYKNQWLIPVNLGSQINSRFNEIGPNLTKNGRRMFFSSDRSFSLGGYDLYEAMFDETQSAWKDAQNLAKPINSSSDDVDIELASDGLSAIYASNRIGSLGGMDLYIAYFKNQILDQLDYVEVPAFVSRVNDKVIIDTTMLDTSLVYVQDTPVNNKFKEAKPIKEFITKPLYFMNDDQILGLGNVAMIRKVADIMTIYPNIKVLFTSHFTPESRSDFDLYFSIKRAEKVAATLASLGIDQERITLMGCGANYPTAQHYFEGNLSSLATKTNRRIDISFYDVSPDNYLRIVPETPVVVELYKDEKWEDFDLKNQGLTFRVKYTTVNQMLKNEVLSLRSDAIIQKQGNTENEYIYTFGNELTYAEARVIKADVRQKTGKQDISITPYIVGVPLTKQQIALLKDQYPELQIYLQQE